MAKVDEAPKGDEDTQSESSDTPKKQPKGSVTYIGTSNIRTISVDEFANAGVEATEDLRWDSQNDHTVDAKSVNASTLEYLRSEPDFRVN